MSNATGGEPEEGMVHEDDDVDSEDDVQGIDETLPSNSNVVRKFVKQCKGCFDGRVANACLNLWTRILLIYQGERE